MNRPEIWITNAVKWRPADGERTRAPLAGEVAQGKPWLLRELDIIRPGVILCLGNVAAKALIDSDFRMAT